MVIYTVMNVIAAASEGKFGPEVSIISYRKDKVEGDPKQSKPHVVRRK